MRTVLALLICLCLPLPLCAAPPAAAAGVATIPIQGRALAIIDPVSYTHLTLPTN